MTAAWRPGPSDGARRGRPSERPGRLAIGIVGAGRVGAVVGAALLRAGHRVVGASGVSDESLSRIDSLLAGRPAPRCRGGRGGRRARVPHGSRRRARGASRRASPPSACGDRARSWSTAREGTGSPLSTAAAARGAIPMAIHPAMTFTGTSLDLDRMVGATFAVTAPGAFLPIAQALVVEMGGEPLALEDAARPLYHAALVHGGESRGDARDPGRGAARRRRGRGAGAGIVAARARLRRRRARRCRRAR